MRCQWADRLELWKIHAGGLGVVMVLSLLGYVFGLGPSLARHAEARSLSVAIDQRRLKADELERRENALRAELSRTRSELARRALRLQTATYRNQRLALLTELAAANDLVVDGLQTTDVEHDERYDMVPIQIEGSGEFPDCARFLHLLNAKFLDTGVRSFELRGNPSSRSSDAFFRFEMIWYAAPTVAAVDGDADR